MHVRRLATLALLGTTTALAALPGCAGPETTAGDDSSLPASVSPMAWRYWPVRMRVHPLSRLVIDPERDETIIEARIEFLDAEGHTTKALGALTVELFDGPARSGANPTLHWQVIRLDDPTTNRVHFDPVTQTYLLRLEVEGEQVPDTPVLRVRLEANDGARLAAELQIRTQ